MAKRILLVDDDAIVLKTLQKCLCTYSYEVVTALGGSEALEKAKIDSFDLIISDVRMPNMNGVETIKKIREIYQEKKCPKIPAIMITGYSRDKTYRQAIELGVTDYLYKPFDLEQFVQAVNRNLKSSSNAYKRSQPRIPLYLTMQIKVKDAVTEKTFQCQTSDLSEGGIGIHTKEKIPLQAITQQIQLGPSDGVPIQIETQVVWSLFPELRDGEFRYGLQFCQADASALKQLFDEIILEDVRTYFHLPIPDHIQEICKGNYILERMDQKQIMEAIDFTPPFLKTEKIILIGRDRQDLAGTKTLAVGHISTKDTAGHYNETIFLALCGYLMASSASIHLAMLFPSTAPQVIEANGVKPLVCSSQDGKLWKPSKTGTPFFVESRILKKRMQLVIMETKVSFGRVIFGIITELKLILTPKEFIWSAKEIPTLEEERGF